MSKSKPRDEDGEWWPKLIIGDYLGRERSNPRPFLVFDRSDGKLTIADDYETSNDLTARDFGVSQKDAVKLASALLHYAMKGTPSETGSVDQFDIEQLLRTA